MLGATERMKVLTRLLEVDCNPPYHINQADCIAVSTALIKRDKEFCSSCKTIEQMVPRMT